MAHRQAADETSTTSTSILLPTFVMLCLAVMATATNVNGDPPAASPTEINVTMIINCSANDTTTPIPTSISLSDRKTLVLTLGSETNQNCSWIISPSTDNSSNVFLFDEHFRTTVCQNGSLALYNLHGRDLNSSVDLIADACDTSSVQVMGRRGQITLVRFASTAITDRNITLGVYMTYVWPRGQCLKNAEPVYIDPGQNKTTFRFPSVITRLPDFMSCFWTFRSSDGFYRGARTSFNVKLEHNHDVDPSAIQDCSNNTLDSFMIMNGGIPGVSKKSLTIPWCRNNASFQHKVVDGAFMLAFVSEGDTGGAPPFVLSFWAEAADYSCPVSPLHLSAEFGHVKLLKGVTPVADYPCRWTITAPSPDQVVMLVNVLSATNDLSFQGCFDDVLTFDNTKTAGSCELQTLVPYWGQSQSTSVQFHSRQASQGYYVYVYYAAVYPGPCQGHPLSITVNGSSQMVQEAAFSKERREDFVSNMPDAMNRVDKWIGGGDNSSGSICVWLLRTERPGDVVSLAVRQDTPCNHSDSCYVDGLLLYDGDRISPSNRIQASSVSMTTTTLTYTSRTDTVLVVFDKMQGLKRHGHGDLHMTFVSQEASTGAASFVARSEFAWLVCSVLACLFV